MLDVPAVIVMPENAPRVKLAATRGYLEHAPAGDVAHEYVDGFVEIGHGRSIANLLG